MFTQTCSVLFIVSETAILNHVVLTDSDQSLTHWKRGASHLHAEITSILKPRQSTLQTERPVPGLRPGNPSTGSPTHQPHTGQWKRPPSALAACLGSGCVGWWHCWTNLDRHRQTDLLLLLQLDTQPDRPGQPTINCSSSTGGHMFKLWKQ